MHAFWRKVEHIVDMSIPFALILLIAILVVEFFNSDALDKYPFIEYLDMLIVAIFVADLGFKFYHSATIPFFLKTYWLEIIAVFPFFLIFRLLDGLGLVSLAIGETAIREGQSIVHAGETATKEAEVISKTLATAQKEAAAISRTAQTVSLEAEALSKTALEAESVIKITRAQRLTRFVKPIFDSRKTLHAADFYEHPHHRKIRSTVQKSVA